MSDMRRLRQCILHYRLQLAAVMFALMLSYGALAAASPEVATPVGVGLVALALLFSVLVRVFSAGGEE